MNSKHRQVQKCVSLSIGLLCWFLGGIVFGFNAYAISLKETFNYTQTELDYIASSGDFGLSLNFLAGVAFDKFGTRVSCTISFILTATGFTLMWMATTFRIYFSSKFWLFCIFYFLASTGTLFVFVPSMVVNCMNFDIKHSGKILGFLNTMFGASPAIYSAIYEGFFVQGHITDPGNQKLGEFMIMLAVISTFITLSAILMLKIVPEDTIDYEEIDTSRLADKENVKDITEYDEIDPPRATDKENDKHLYNINTVKKDEETNNTTERIREKTATAQSFQMEMTFWQMMKTTQFYYIFIICIIIGGLGGSFTNNITTVLQSSVVEMKPITFTVAIPFFASMARFFGGAIPDFIFERWPHIPKASILLFPCLMTCSSHIVFSFFNQNSIGLIFASIMAALAYGAFYVQISVVIIHFFGLKYFGQNNGLVLVSHGIGIVLFQKLFAMNYESYSPTGSNYCYGDMCTKWYFALASMLSLCAMFLNVCLMKFERY
ncbi:unnamed protein product [Owenia fusiformis]|uniref:Uncharacterized protein n=1 Tax=Owenia fusiformis TaxID=6347 RepID=A0A8J1TKS0_OWEFU|nr:unnamed protein product [Owenia fusiformis]